MDILRVYLEYLSKEQVSSAAGIGGFESISSGVPLKMPEDKNVEDELELEEEYYKKQARKIRRK
jgi:hypothetical protein